MLRFIHHQGRKEPEEFEMQVKDGLCKPLATGCTPQNRNDVTDCHKAQVKTLWKNCEVSSILREERHIHYEQIIIIVLIQLGFIFNVEDRAQEKEVLGKVELNTKFSEFQAQFQNYSLNLRQTDGKAINQNQHA